jgi:putative spermidine/putrescine transport system permease protein
MLLDYPRLGSWRFALVAVSAGTAAFLLLPIVMIVVLSFGTSEWLQFPPPGWTLRWYGQVFDDTEWISSFFLSLEVASIVTVLSVALGLMTSFGLTRGTFPGRELLRGLFLTPMILPVVIVAVALYAFFLRAHLNGTLAGLVVAHLVIALPFSIIAISTALEGFDERIEAAAVLCGAGPFEAKWRVTLPAIRLGLFSAAIFSFLASWDECVIAIFMASPDLQTLPVRIWGTLRQDLSPVIAAVSALLIALTAGLVTLAFCIRKEPGT